MLRPLPKDLLAQFGPILLTFGDCQEMISRKLPHLAGEVHAAICEQDLRLAESAGVENELARRRIAGRVLEAHAEIGVAQGNPAAFAAPADMNDALLIRQKREEKRAGLRCKLFFEPRLEAEVVVLDRGQFFQAVGLLELAELHVVVAVAAYLVL